MEGYTAGIRLVKNAEDLRSVNLECCMGTSCLGWLLHQKVFLSIRLRMEEAYRVV